MSKLVIFFCQFWHCLSAILKIDPSDIKETQILNTYLRKEHEEDKQGILDVRILDFILFEEPTNVSDDSKPATQSNFTHAFIFGMITGTFFLQIVKNVWNMKQEKKLFEIINKWCLKQKKVAKKKVLKSAGNKANLIKVSCLLKICCKKGLL